MDGKKLELIHVLFRHGERTPDEITFYREENKTGANEYYPYGIGQLTNRGKKVMYELGKDLRQHYGDFLGEMYFPKHVETLTSEFERCRTSLLVVLAGLYPPQEELIWNDELQWQPIATKYIPAQNDMIFLGGFTQKYREMYKENFKRSAYGQKLLEDYKDILAYVKEHAGLEITNTFQVFKLRDCLIREKLFNIRPKWATDFVISKLEELVLQEMNVMMMETTDLKGLFSGSLLEKIVHDSREKIHGSSTRKLHLYSGHEVNIVGILNILEVLKPHLPEEGCCVVVELYSTNKGHEVQVKYKTNRSGSFDAQPFPYGQLSWPFEKVEELLKKYDSIIPGFVPEEKIGDRVFTK